MIFNKSKGQVSNVAILAIVVIGGVLLVQPSFLGDITQPSDDTDCPPQNAGESATLSLASFDRTEDSSTQVAASNYKWRDNSDRTYLGSDSGSASSRTTVSSYVVGCDEMAEAVAFDDTYEYGVEKQREMLTSEELVNLDVWEAVSTSNINIRFFDDTGSTTTSVSLSADQTYVFEKFDAQVNANNKAWNPELVMFDVPSGTNVSNIDVPGAERVDVPQAEAGTYEYAFKVGDSSQEPSLRDYERTVQDSIQVTADSDGTNGETVTVAYVDYAPYITQDDELAYGVEDDTSSPSLVGTGKATKDLTLN